METTTIIFHILVIIMSTVIFSMKITAANYMFQFLLRTISKLVPVFCIMYSGIQIFKYLGFI